MTPKLNNVEDGNTLITDPALTGILNSYITQQSLTSTLTSYQSLLTPGTGISISNNVISATSSGSGGGGSTLALQVNGVAQSATTVNLVDNNAKDESKIAKVAEAEPDEEGETKEKEEE